MNEFVLFDNAFINGNTGEYIFQCAHQYTAESEFSELGHFAVKISCADWSNVRLCSLTKVFVEGNAKLTYSETKGLYYFPFGGSVHIYNEEFFEVSALPLPSLVNTYQMDERTEYFHLSPNRCIVSPSGKYLVLDYFEGFIIVDSKVETLLHYKFSSNPVTDIYFISDSEIVYSCGTSTYIERMD